MALVVYTDLLHHSAVATAYLKDGGEMDTFYILLMIGFFILSLCLVVLCEQLMEERP